MGDWEIGFIGLLGLIGLLGFIGFIRFRSLVSLRSLRSFRTSIWFVGFGVLWGYKGLKSSQDDAQICGTGSEGGAISSKKFFENTVCIYA